jgi:glycosyltransferase involved in cell wall biosynthesis
VKWKERSGAWYRRMAEMAVTPVTRSSARPRRVLLLVDSLGNGGAERQLALLASSLPPAWERHVWSLGGGPFVEVIRASGVPVRVCARSHRLDPRPALDLWRVLRRWRPDVVHSWGWMATAAAGPACRLLGIPLIDGTVRNGMVPLRRGLANRLSMHWAERVIANSRAGLRAYRLTPARGRVVYNGFDPARLPLCAAASPDPAGPFTAVMTGRMVPEKDYRTFLAAARELSRTGGAWRFLAVGDGPDRPLLLRDAGDLASRGVVAFPRPGLEVLTVVREAHAGVLMTDPARHAEGCSNAIMEYMACGLPVVCADSGGNRELVRDGETGFVIPPADTTALAGRLRWLADHPAQARRMGERGRARLLHDFTVDAMVAGTVAVYEELLMPGGGQTADARGWPAQSRGRN